MDRDVVVTGIGVISPVASGREDYWTALKEGRTGFRAISLFDTSGYECNVAGEITDFDPLLYLDKKGLRTLDRSTKLLCSAAKLALDDAGLEITGNNSHAIGVSVGSTFGSLRSIAEFDREGLTEGPRYVNPSFFPNTVLNSPASNVSIRFGIKGFNTTISTGFCASLDAIIYASDFIQLGRTEVVLAGGVEELCEETFLLFHKLGFMSGVNGTIPISCPFDARRNGFILSEGSAILVLESREHALKRGARILARISGYGNSFEPPGGTMFGTGRGLRNAINSALMDSLQESNEIDYICAGANSSRELDIIETQVIQDVFRNNTLISAVKSMIGETFSAAGAMALSASIGGIIKKFIPPTMNYLEKEPGSSLNIVANEAKKKDINNVLVLSSDPLGNNTALIINRFSDE